MSGDADVGTATKSKTQSRHVTFQKPDVRLAVCPVGEEGGANSVRHHIEDCGLGRPPTVRLAHVDGAQGDCTLKGEKGVPQIDQPPALLVSFYYLEPFEANREAYFYRDWVLDSGAFSAHNSGATTDLNEYIDKCLQLLSTDKTLTEVFSLDVIPKDHKPVTVQKAAEQSVKNCEEMWRQGVPAIPTFHRGEDEAFLFEMAKQYPKIAIGGVALLRGDQKRLFCEQVFARVWPKKIHGLGMSSEELVYGLPFHSVDATNWEIAPCAFGSWQKFGQMSVRGSNQDLRSQVKYYLAMEAKARVRWAKQMEELEALAPSPAVLGSPSVRLSMAENGDKSQRLNPTVRLAIEPHSGRAENNFTGAATETATAPAKPKQTKAKANKPTPEPAPAEKPAGELDAKWVDYWKDRLK